MPARTISVKPRKRTEIERIADQFLESFSPSHLKSPGRFPAAEFIEFDMPSQFGVEFTVRNIGPAVEGVTMPLPGPTGETEWIVMLDTQTYEELRADDPRARFTAIHEFGHVMLHRDEVGRALIQGRPGLRRERGKIPAYRDAEWQAHTFAGEILAPRQTVLQITQRTEPARWVPTIRDAFGISWGAAKVRLSVLRQQGMLS